jgi:hypothetical protein
MAKSDPADGWSEGISINFLDAKTMGFAKSSSHHTRSFAQRRSSIALERLAKPSKESKYPVGEQNQPVEEKQHEADRPQQENNDASGAPHRARSLVRLQLIPIGKRSPHQRRAILVFFEGPPRICHITGVASFGQEPALQPLLAFSSPSDLPDGQR